jgi:hypothetical protein
MASGGPSPYAPHATSLKPFQTHAVAGGIGVGYIRAFRPRSVQRHVERKRRLALWSTRPRARSSDNLCCRTRPGAIAEIILHDADTFGGPLARLGTARPATIV